MEREERKEWLGRGWAFPVAIDPINGRLALAEYEADIRQAIEIILGTAPGERVMRPDFGCGVHDLAFEALDTTTITRIETAVREALARYEARIEVLAVDVGGGDRLRGEVIVELEYRVRRTNQTGNLTYPFYFDEGGLRGRGGERG